MTDHAAEDHVLTNPRAERVKRVASLAGRSARQKQKLFLTEGPQPVREALKSWLHRWEAEPVNVRVPELDALYYTPEALDRHPDLLALLDRIRGVLFNPESDLPRHARVFIREVSSEVITAMSDAETPQGVVAVCRIPQVSDDVGQLESTLVGWISARNDGAMVAEYPPVKLAVCLLRLQDPGNVGTIIRTADAAGAGVVVLSPGSADPWSPKVVRAAAGSHFHLPIFTGIDPHELTSFVRDQDIRVFAADGSAELSLPDLQAGAHGTDLNTGTLWLMGNEAQGLSAEELSLADAAVSIPLYGQAESLNVATAATICLYASAMAQNLAPNPARNLAGNSAEPPVAADSIPAEPVNAEQPFHATQPVDSAQSVNESQPVTLAHLGNTTLMTNEQAATGSRTSEPESQPPESQQPALSGSATHQPAANMTAAGSSKPPGSPGLDVTGEGEPGPQSKEDPQ